MSSLYLDTSALAKLYIKEEGTEELLRLVDGIDGLMVGSLCVPEFISATRRLLREGQLDEETCQRLKIRFLGDLARMELIPCSDEVLRLSVEVIEGSAVRTLDALHIAMALSIGAGLFVTADKRQAEAARASGLVPEVVG